MVRSIDPYLNAEDVRRISSGRSLCFIDIEPHTPNSVMLVNGVVYHVRSTTAMKAMSVPSLYEGFGYDAPRNVAAALQTKFPKMDPAENVYVIRIGRCLCSNCHRSDDCPDYDASGVCPRWMRGVDA